MVGGKLKLVQGGFSQSGVTVLVSSKPQELFTMMDGIPTNSLSAKPYLIISAEADPVKLLINKKDPTNVIIIFFIFLPKSIALIQPMGKRRIQDLICNI